MLTDPRIHSFLAVCEHGTTTAAAVATHRALSTISTHVGAIEARVGAALFKRAHGAFILTDLGEEVRKHAEIMVAAEAAIIATATRARHGEQPQPLGVPTPHPQREQLPLGDLAAAGAMPTRDFKKYEYPARFLAPGL